MELHSPSETEPEPTLSLGIRESRIATVAILTIYREAALANYAEAEDLIHRALELREIGHAMLERASQLAFACAMEGDSPQELETVEEDLTPW